MEFLTMLAQEQAGAFMISGLFLVWVALAIVGFGLWLWGLISAIQNPSLDSTMRIVWVLVIIFTGFIGAIIYLLIGRNGTATDTR